MFCKVCGKEINDNAVVCTNCGCQISDLKEQEQKKEESKVNVLCIVGFILSCISLLIALWGIVAIAGCTLSIVGIIQARKKKEKLIGLGIAGVVVGGVSLIYTIIVLCLAITLLV